MKRLLSLAIVNLIIFVAGSLGAEEQEQIVNAESVDNDWIKGTSLVFENAKGPKVFLGCVQNGDKRKILTCIVDDTSVWNGRRMYSRDGMADGLMGGIAMLIDLNVDGVWDLVYSKIGTSIVMYQEDSAPYLVLINETRKTITEMQDGSVFATIAGFPERVDLERMVVNGNKRLPGGYVFESGAWHENLNEDK